MPQGNRTLIFFTDEFPFGSGEAFIENELPYLSTSFDKIFIVTNDLGSKNPRPIPPSIKVVRISYNSSFNYKIMALLSLFSPTIAAERKIWKERLKLAPTLERLTILLSAYATVLRINEFLKDIVSAEGLARDKLFLYSYWMNNMAGGIALFKKYHPEVRAFCRAHRWDIYMEQQPGQYLPLKNFIVENLDFCFPISEDGAKYLKQLLHHKFDNKIDVAHLGTIGPPQANTYNPSGKFQLVSCSSLIARKRVSLIIEALSEIDDIEIKWTHLGDGPLLQDLKSTAEEFLSKKSNMSFEFRGQVSNHQIKQSYSNESFDLFINVSESEGIPVSIMEAFSYGIPCIGTDVGGTSEIIETGKNGFLIDKNSAPGEVAKVIKEFIRLGQEKKQSMRDNAYLSWKNKFDASRNYNQFIDRIFSL